MKKLNDISCSSLNGGCPHRDTFNLRGACTDSDGLKTPMAFNNNQSNDRGNIFSRDVIQSPRMMINTAKLTDNLTKDPTYDLHNFEQDIERKKERAKSKNYSINNHDSDNIKKMRICQEKSFTT